MCSGICLDISTPPRAHARWEVKGGMGKGTEKHVRKNFVLYL